MPKKKNKRPNIPAGCKAARENERASSSIKGSKRPAKKEKALLKEEESLWNAEDKAILREARGEPLQKAEKKLLRRRMTPFLPKAKEEEALQKAEKSLWKAEAYGVEKSSRVSEVDVKKAQDDDTGDSDKETPVVVEDKGMDTINKDAVEAAVCDLIRREHTGIDTDVFSDEDKKDVARYLADGDITFKTIIYYNMKVWRNGTIRLLGRCIRLVVGEKKKGEEVEELIDELLSIRFETGLHKTPSVFILKSAEDGAFICSSKGYDCSREKVLLAVKAFTIKTFLLVPPPEVYWTKPPKGCLKLNTTGVCLYKLNGVGIGVVMRNDLGEWCFGSWGRLEGVTIDSLDMVQIKLLGLKEGLSMAVEYFPDDNILIETSSEEIVELLLNIQYRQDLHDLVDPWDILARDCWELLKRLRYYEVREIEILANKVAVLLANGGGYFMDKVKTSDKPPENLHNILHRESTVSSKQLQKCNVDEFTWVECLPLGARELMITCGDDPRYWEWTSSEDPRYNEVAKLLCGVLHLLIKGSVKTSLLFPETPYKAFLIFKLDEKNSGLESMHVYANTIESKGVEQAQRWTLTVHLKDVEVIKGAVPYKRHDGWMEVQIGKFYNEGGQEGEVHVEIWEISSDFSKDGLIVAGMEFLPIFSRLV